MTSVLVTTKRLDVNFHNMPLREEFISNLTASLLVNGAVSSS